MTKRTFAVLTLSLALIAAACSSSTDDTTTTSSTDDTTSTTVPIEAMDAEMCRTLELLESAGVPPTSAAVSMEAVDLTAANSQERSAYGDLLISAPRTECPASIAYADEIAYWLGF